MSYSLAIVSVEAGSVWVSLMADGTLVHLDAPVALQLSSDGRMAAVVNTYGRFGQIVDPTIGTPQMWIVDNGWVWHPWGIVRSWNLAHWREANCWESEDGGSVRRLCDRSYLWDAPLCWVGEATLAVWGEGRDDEEMLPTVQIFDVISGERLRWFAGPDVAPHHVWPPASGRRGWMIYDRWLFVISPRHGMGIWDVASGERLHHDPACMPLVYHRGGRQFLTFQSDEILRVSTLVGKA